MSGHILQFRCRIFQLSRDIMLGEHAQRFRHLLAGQAPIITPGVYDALSSALVAEAGFQAAYLSGASIAYTKLGRPDIGLVSAAEVGDTIAHIRERVEIPLIVDADTGFGNVLNVQRTVKTFERMGASAIQIEDQVMPKRCGHLTGKSLISKEEMVGKIKAALDARVDANTSIIARTDAIAVEGFDAAIDRAKDYADAGCDVLFIEAPASLDQVRRISELYAGRIPLLANMVEGGATPIVSANALNELGFRIVIYPGALVRAVVWTAQRMLASLRENGTTSEYRDRMLDIAGLNDVIGTAAMLEAGERYDSNLQPAVVSRGDKS
jgi:2-methylisocitrate lyase-like PEP mutase family enzyme